jgi:hypothetical protein
MNKIQRATSSVLIRAMFTFAGILYSARKATVREREVYEEEN